MKELSFDEHFEILKQLLQVNPCLKKEDEAEKIISQYKDIHFFNGGYIHIDNLNTIAVKDLSRIGTLAHEMRHAWQFKNKIEEGFCFNVPVNKLEKIKSLIVYLIGKKELDANKFTFHYCMLMGLKKQSKNHFFPILSTWVFRLIIPILILFVIVLI